MPALPCEDIIRKHLRRNMTEEEALEFAEEGRRLARRAKAGARGAELSAEVARYTAHWQQRQLLATAVKERALELQLATRKEAVDFITSEFKGMEAEGISALMVGSKYTRAGARLSVDSLRGSLAGRYLGGMLTELEACSSNYARMLRDETQSRQIAEALWSLTDARIDYQGPALALELAKVIHKYQELARRDENNAGAWIGSLPGYVCRQSHDPARLRKAGFANWKAAIEQRLDWERTAGGRYDGNVDPDGRDRFLEEVYAGLVSGIHEKYHPPGVAAKPEPLTSAGSMGSLAARASQERVLHFRNGGDWFDYNRQFGRGTLADAIVSGLGKSANDIALMRVFGPSPQQNLKGIVADIQKLYRERGDYTAIQLTRNWQKRLDNQMKELDGTLNMEGNPTLAAVSRSVRAIESMSKLGGALISGFSDIPMLAQELAWQGRGFFQSMAEGLATFVRGRGSLAERRVLAQCGVFFDSMTGNLLQRFSGQDAPGKLTALMNVFFRLNGLSFWGDCWKKSVCLMMAHDLAELAGTGFAQLGPKRQRALSLYKIDEPVWEMLRKGNLTAADGRNYLTADAAYSISRSELQSYMHSKGLLINDERVELMREEIANRLRAYYKDRVQYAILEPDARTAAIIHQGQAAGTVPGEALRFVMQFKSFPVVFLQRTLGREIHGRGSDSLARGLANALLPRGGETGALAGMILATTAFGYLSMCTKALLAGRTPRDITDPETFPDVFRAALLQGGGLGLYGDFFLGEKSRMGDDFLASVAGPAMGSASSLVSLYKSVRDGEDAGAMAFRTLWSHLPGQNLFWAKTAMDQLLLNSIYEYLNPGFLRKQRRRMERETNQEFYMEPHVWDWAGR